MKSPLPILQALLLFALTTNEAQSNDAVQILDDHSVSCIDQTFDILDMPGARYGTTGYGEISKEKRISDDFSARVILDTDKLSYTYITSLSANIYHHRDNHTDYRHRASITLYFNNENRLTNITHSPYNSAWFMGDNMYYSPSEKPPELSDENREAIESWIMQTIEAAAFMMTYCQSNGADIYTPENGEAVGPPEFLELYTTEGISP